MYSNCETFGISGLEGTHVRLRPVSLSWWRHRCALYWPRRQLTGAFLLASQCGSALAPASTLTARLDVEESWPTCGGVQGSTPEQKSSPWSDFWWPCSTLDLSCVGGDSGRSLNSNLLNFNCKYFNEICAERTAHVSPDKYNSFQTVVAVEGWFVGALWKWTVTSPSCCFRDLWGNIERKRRTTLTLRGVKKWKRVEGGGGDGEGGGDGGWSKESVTGGRGRWQRGEVSTSSWRILALLMPKRS